jgi:uncharacterized small protein (DUF1192 family)
MSAQAPEIPDAKDRFEKSLAVSIACMAVVLAIISDQADAAKTEAILSTNEAANAWSYFQAKSTKQHVTESDLYLLGVLEADGEAGLRAKLGAEVERYEAEKNTIKLEAEQLTAQATHARSVDDRAGQGALFLQLAIVLASVAMLARWSKLWILSLLVGLVGAGVGLSSWLM